MNRDFHVGAHVMLAYIYNTSGFKFANDVFPGEHEDYLNEKAEAWGHSPVRALGYLDREHFARVVEIAIDQYGAQAEAQIGGVS